LVEHATITDSQATKMMRELGTYNLSKAIVNNDLETLIKYFKTEIALMDFIKKTKNSASWVFQKLNGEMYNINNQFNQEQIRQSTQTDIENNEEDVNVFE
ncbi:hypothetical protein, partial [Mycoplasma sp. CSL7503-lung]|uniref:hypothetical protein n=1 Tax=Mycoplasma sp. CSL7503-lung TaxID=536372 RepID=UPI0021D115AF